MNEIKAVKVVLRRHLSLARGNGIHKDVRVATYNRRVRKERMRILIAKALYIPSPRLRLGSINGRTEYLILKTATN